MGFEKVENCGVGYEFLTVGCNIKRSLLRA